MKQIKLAIFDFDGTLFTQETIPFLIKQYRKLGYPRLRQYKIICKLIILLLKYKTSKKLTKEIFRGKATIIFLELFKGYSREEVKTFFEKNINEIVLHTNLNVVSEIEILKNKGYKTILLSGCFTEVLKELIKRWNIDVYLGTELMYLKDNSEIDYNHKIKIISGDNKVTKLLEYTKDMDINWKDSYAFGDSFYDLGVLNMVGIPVAVRPDDKLLDVAKEKKWRIIN